MFNKNNNQQHSFHLVDPSPWPIITSFSAFLLTGGGVLYMHGYLSSFVWKFGLFMILFMMFVWWRDVVREATFEGQHTYSVQSGIRLGMILFIVSEVMFFFSFFWAFFHSSINPSIFIGGVWPPAFFVVLNPWKIPFLNTVLLLSSGATVTWAHHAIVYGSKKQTIIGMALTIILALIFTALQGVEYVTAPFTISDGVYGTVFFMITGFHGFHVIIGTCFLIVCLLRVNLDHFTQEQHIGLESAIWYWHFVDVIWIFVFIVIYIWGS